MRILMLCSLLERFLLLLELVAAASIFLKSGLLEYQAQKR
jgi:hypothetical protein